MQRASKLAEKVAALKLELEREKEKITQLQTAGALRHKDTQQVLRLMETGDVAGLSKVHEMSCELEGQYPLSQRRDLIPVAAMNAVFDTFAKPASAPPPAQAPAAAAPIDKSLETS